MIIFTIALVIAVAASLQLKRKVTIKERCMFKSQLGTILLTACLPILIVAMLDILSFDLIGLVIIVTTGIVFSINRCYYTKKDNYAVCD